MQKTILTLRLCLLDLNIAYYKKVKDSISNGFLRIDYQLWLDAEKENKSVVRRSREKHNYIMVGNTSHSNIIAHNE